MNKAFEIQDFWQLYLALEGIIWNEEREIIREINKDIPLQLINELNKNFETAVDEEEGEYKGRKYKIQHLSVHFVFILKNFELLIEFHPDISGSTINLFLYHNDNEYLLGWRDCARWHPYCLRYSEFLLILKQIKKYDNQWKDSLIPLLLLKDFVGFGGEDNEHRLVLSKQAEVVLNELNIDNTDYLAPCHIKEKYQWVETALGWEFTADYSCYSIRNAPHKDSKEGQFPFNLWRQLMNQMKDEI